MAIGESTPQELRIVTEREVSGVPVVQYMYVMVQGRHMVQDPHVNMYNVFSIRLLSSLSLSVSLSPFHFLSLSVTNTHTHTHTHTLIALD